MGEYREEINYNVRKELHLIASIIATALLIGIVIGFLDGLLDIVSNNIVFDHPTDDQTLSFFPKVLYLIYSMTLSGIFYGVLGLVSGVVLLSYDALWHRRLDTSAVFLLYSWLLFSFIVLKTGVLLFSKFIPESLIYKILFLGIVLFVCLLFSYKFLYRKNLPDSPKGTDFTTLSIRLVITSILFWGSISLLAKMLGEQISVLVPLIILATGVILTLIFYQLVKRMFTRDRFMQRQHRGFVVRKSTAFLMAFLVILSCLGIYRENKLKDSYKHKDNSYSAQENKDKPNVVLILIDTLRADHLSSYGYGRQTSPNIDKIAKEGVLFQNAVAPASWTKPSTASLLTSLYPSMHGVIYGESMLSDSITTLAEYVKGAGYRTAGFIANPQVKAIFNFDQGFNFYDDSIVEDKIYYDVLRSRDLEKEITRRLFKLRLNWTDNNNAEMLNRKFIPWLRGNKDSNFFLYIHYIDPHEPYSPPSPFNAKYATPKMGENQKNMALYDGEIAYTDRYVGDLLRALEELNIADETLVILTSDHGEEFLDHGGTGHGQSLYEEQIRVPLIMRYSSFLSAGKVIKNRIEIIDIMPTVLEILGIAHSGHMEGASLLPLLEAKAVTDGEDYIFNESYLSRFEGRAITYKGWKYIFTESSELRDINKLGPAELYNLGDDPKELNNLITDRSEMAKKLREKLLFLTRYVKENAVSQPERATVDEKTKQQLKALGYVD